MAIEAADGDFDFSIYDTNPQDGVLTPDELVVVIITAEVGNNYHRGAFRAESDFIPGSFQQFNVVDPDTNLTYIAERGQLPGQVGLFDYRFLYYGRNSPTQSTWTMAQARNHYLQSSQTHTITGATNATPIVITSANHGLATGDPVYIYNVGGNSAANGNRKVTRIDANRFSLQNADNKNIAGSGAYTSGGSWTSGSYSNVGDGANIRTTDINVQTDDGVLIPKGFRAAAVGQWRGFITQAHEISHLLHPDALDLYNYESKGVQAEINGYSTMGGTGSGTYHHDPWTKTRLGWVTPSVVDTATTVVLTNVETTGRVIKIPRPGNSQEYFLLENRWGGSSYDATSHAKTNKVGLPGTGVADEGLAIWHVDESRLAAFNAGDYSAPPFLRKVDASNTPNNGSDDLFDGSTDFHALTTPNSNWNDGTPSDLVVTAISSPGPTITLEIDFTGVPRDALEPNDSFEFSHNLGSGDQTINQLTIHRNNDDYYQWIAPATGTVNIDLLFSHSLGDIDASLHQGDASHTTITSSTSSSDNEHLSASIIAGQTYYLRAYGFSGAMNPDCDLIIDATDAVGDRFETNNTFLTATPLGTGGRVELGLSIHDSSDEDFFRWYAPAAGFFQVNIVFEHSAGDLDLLLYDENFNLIATANSTTDDETIQIADITPLQAYYIRVVGFNGAINPTYDLGIISPAIPADFLEPNDSFEFARYLGMADQTQSHLSIHTAGNDDYYRWRAPATGRLSVDLEFLHEVGDLDLYLYDAKWLELASSRSTTDNERVDWNVEKGATYYIKVTGYNGAIHHDYQLVLNGPDIPTDRLEPNDSFAAATNLGTGDLLEQGLTIHVTNNDDYFQWTAPAGGTLALNLYFEQLAGDLDLYLFSDPSFDDQIASSKSSTDSEQIVYPVVAGWTYYILVDGYLGATNFDYTLSIDSPEPISADFDTDGDIDGTDFLAWQRGAGISAPSATKGDGDADNDTDVDSTDLEHWADQFGQSQFILFAPLPMVSRDTRNATTRVESSAKPNRSAMAALTPFESALLSLLANGLDTAPPPGGFKDTSAGAGVAVHPADHNMRTETGQDAIGNKVFENLLPLKDRRYVHWDPRHLAHPQSSHNKTAAIDSALTIFWQTETLRGLPANAW